MHIRKIKKYYPLALIFVCLAVIGGVIYPTVQDIVQLKREIGFEREKLETLYQKGQLLKKTKQHLNFVRGDVSLLDSAVLRPGQELFLITTLENIASENNLEQRITIDDLLDPLDTNTTLPITVTLTGTFEHMLSYLANSETLDFYLNWNRVTIRSSQQASRGSVFPRQAPSQDNDANDNDVELTAVLEGETYWIPE